jgi:DNA repair protein RadC
LDHFDAVVHSDGTPVEHIDAGIQAECLPMVNHTYESVDAVGLRPPNLYASKAGGSDGCRSIMAQILAPVALHQPRAVANRLIDEFGSVKATLAARPAHLARVLKNDQAALLQIRSMASALDHCLKARVESAKVDVSEAEVSEYLKFRIGFATIEIFYVLYFNALGGLIHDAALSHGNLTSCEANARSIIQAALDVGAATVVLAHNHPSGDPTPSRADINITRRISEACRQFDIRVFDHLVISRERVESFRASGLL